ncbi:MAG: aldehyde reductase [Bacteroidota bacterium]|nr:aldehyde reductase [Bacteroidota bacterium]
MKNTVLITGGTGYIGTHITEQLLEKGYHVKLAVRDAGYKSKFEYLTDAANLSSGTLEIFQADLLVKGSFDEAAKGCSAIFHVASPFKLKFDDAVKELVEPALEGTKNVLGAATKSGTVKKVILTSSVAAVHGDNIDMQEIGIEEFTEEHYNTSSSIEHQPYSYSKVTAEKEAWSIYEKQDAWELAVINPSFVMGPSLSETSQSGSLSFMKDMLRGKYQMGAPLLTFGFVDVRDVAKAHILALENKESKGRYILAERVITVFEFSQIIKNLYGKRYRLPITESPKFMLYMVGWMFGLTGKFIKRNVGYPIKLNTQKSKKQLGLKYTPLEQTIEDMIVQMQEQEVIS